MLSLFMYIHFIVAVIISVSMYVGLKKHFKKICWSDRLFIVGVVALLWEWWIIKFGYEFIEQGRE